MRGGAATCSAMPGDCLWLLRVRDALPAVEAHFERWPHDLPPIKAELRELVELTARFVAVSDVLLRYVKALDGRPSKN